MSNKLAGKAIQRRKPGKERRAEIAEVSARLFAERGFSVSTREIAAELEITQAALYKHFSSKDALIEEVFRTRFLDDRPSEFKTRLTKSDGDLEARLVYAYAEFLREINNTSMKLFHRASYDGLEIAKRYSPHLDRRILIPVLEELRCAAKLPGINTVDVSANERELAMMLHSTIVFLAIRKHVYNIDFQGREDELVALNVSTWLAGALVVVKSLVTP